MAAEPASATVPRDERLLARAAELIARGWCNAAVAQDRHGRQVEPWRETACRWSPLGALLCAWYEDGADRIDDVHAAYRALAFATGGIVPAWNSAPRRTAQHVRSALLRARAYLPDAREQMPGGGTGSQARAT